MKLLNKEVRIETTNWCNASCITCPRDQLSRKRTTMDYNHFVTLVMEAYELGAETISPFGYGEPLMDERIADKVAFCSRMGLSLIHI